MCENESLIVLTRHVTGYDFLVVLDGAVDIGLQPLRTLNRMVL